ncbi:solute carrier family 41 member 1 [Coprinopsis cinerea okayama7|uniref:Solute carrier family 41 member 1 n=1 Tax=Coprinopsis cinerea (strain Okayama-7 / 130 / ATCC MYA-4618 / FGSC 9003) TaxID=240176 RepID=A8P9Z8_COPC7|nr:solute carrier family 41 member 1 [Coprinopsis cinerea okayama7\|eukprot:XP_001839871.1 solute carrier family 41 member 1 [Coprinopsis cinerea okayama7\
MNGNSPGNAAVDDDIELIGMSDVAQRPAPSKPTPPADDTPKRQDEDDSDEEFDGEEGGQALLAASGRPNGHHYPPSQPSRLKRGMDVWKQVNGIVIESAPTLLLTTISLLFSGKLLDQVSRWRAMREVDQLIMIIPAILNLQGNLEMNLSARLSTAANIGELDDGATRKAMILGNLTLLQVQAISVSFIASCLSIILGQFLPQPEGTIPSPSTPSNSTIRHIIDSLEPRKPVPHLPSDASPRSTGLATLIMVSTSAMTSAFLSGLILGSFMCALILFCRRYNLNPDNIAPAVASCLGDLVTLCMIGLVSTLLIPFLHTPLPFIVGITVVIIAVGSLVYTLRNPHVRPLITQGWSPLLGAMIISSATGMILDVFVSRYEGFAILAVVISGLPGATGSIFVSRLSTSLHAAAFALTHPTPSASFKDKEPSARLAMFTLLLITIPVELIFLSVLNALGWLDLPLLFVLFSILFFCFAVFASLVIARWLTNWLWSKNRDPDIYALPIHSALMDLIGQSLLVLCFEIASKLGAKMKTRT